MKKQVQIIQKYGKTFYWASFFLEESIKVRLFSIYAFCRRIDDLVDGSEKKLNKNLKKNFHKRIEEFIDLEKKFYPTKEIMNEFMLGQQSDLSHTQPKSLDELIIYCYRVAGVVGLMVCDVLEVRDIKIRQYAIDLGIAMQLTNICRDIKEDSVMGRIYLPQTIVGKLRANQVNAPNKYIYKKIQSCQKTLLNLADEYYSSAEFAIPFLPGKTSLAIRIASKLYQAIGKKIINKKISYLDSRVFITKMEKLKITLINILTSKKSYNKLSIHNAELHSAIQNLPGVNNS